MQFICSFKTTYGFDKSVCSFTKTVCSFKTAYKLHTNCVQTAYQFFMNKDIFHPGNLNISSEKWSKDNPYMSMTPIYLDILCIQIKIKSLIAQ